MAAESKGLLAERYASALYELAEEQGALDTIASDLKRLGAMLKESPELRRLCASPVLGRSEQGRAVAGLAQRAGFAKTTTDFLGVLVHNRRLASLASVIRAFLSELARRRGEVTATVSSAAPLAEAQMSAVGAALKRAVGGTVTLETAVDPSLLGGLVVQVGSRMIDGSLKTKVQRLSLAMKGIG